MFFFFSSRRRHTRFKCDWSSDVCSSDLSLILPFLAVSLLAAHLGASQQPPSLKAASLESHEGMTITARPWTDPALYKEKFPKNSPFAAGIIAVQVAFRNNSDDRMKINLE